MNDSNTENPLLTDSTPNTYDEAHFTDEAAYALYDAYLMLRDAGFEATELTPLAYCIEQTTIYDATDPERLHQHSE